MFVTSSLCRVMKIDQFTRAAHLSFNSYIRSNKILNIHVVILLVYVDTNHIYKYFEKCILFLIKPLSLTIILPNFASNHRTVFNARGLYWDSIHQTKFSIILKWQYTCDMLILSFHKSSEIDKLKKQGAVRHQICFNVVANFL